MGHWHTGSPPPTQQINISALPWHSFPINTPVFMLCYLAGVFYFLSRAVTDVWSAGEVEGLLGHSGAVVRELALMLKLAQTETKHTVVSMYLGGCFTLRNFLWLLLSLFRAVWLTIFVLRYLMLQMKNKFLGLEDFKKSCLHPSFSRQKYGALLDWLEHRTIRVLWIISIDSHWWFVLFFSRDGCLSLFIHQRCLFLKAREDKGKRFLFLKCLSGLLEILCLRNQKPWLETWLSG